jgi:predicted small secreted protein
MSTTYARAFIFAASTALGGCATTQGIQQDVSQIWDRTKAAVTTTPATQPQSAAEAQAPQTQRALPTGSPVLHPAVQPYLNNIALSRNQTAFDTTQCTQSALQGRGPSSAATNPAAVGNVQGRGMDIIRQGTRRLLGEGTAGQILRSGTDATIDAAQASAGQRSIICGNIGQVSQRFFQADTMSTPAQESTFATGYNTLSSIMTRAANAGLVSGDNTGAGSSAMINRGWNQSQTTGWSKLLNKAYTPKGNGAVWDFVK